LSANTEAHAKQLARVAPRLQLRLLTQRIDRAGERLERASVRGGSALERVAGQRRTRLERTSGRLAPQLLLNRIERARDRMNSSAQMLQSLSYQSVLRRGFALVRNEAGDAVRAAGAIATGAYLSIEFADGRVQATATGSDATPSAPDVPPHTAPPKPQSPSPSSSTPRAKPRPPIKDAGSQGSLF
jgi:exodeoxyribonuclease VII large subunit